MSVIIKLSFDTFLAVNRC